MPETTILQLEEQGYEGTDASIEISLFEYGLLIRENENNEIDVIYGVETDERGEYTRFCRTTFINAESIYEILTENWFDLKGFMSTADYSNICEICNTYLPHLLHSMCQYHGTENVLGSGYGNFKIPKT